MCNVTTHIKARSLQLAELNLQHCAQGDAVNSMRHALTHL